jgi:hypothetical protein
VRKLLLPDLPQGMATSQLVTAALDGLAENGTFNAAVVPVLRFVR